MKISAVIFDLDGTLIDSEGAWALAFNDVLKELGYTSIDNHPHISGVSLKKNWEMLLPKFSIKTNKTFEQLEVLTNNSYVNHLSSVSLMPGATEFIESLKESGAKIGLATSTNWLIADKIFEKLGLKETFDSVTTGEEAVNPKPDPDILLIEADKLGVNEENCLVIEDSPSGVTAAHRAGMKVIAVEDGEDDQPDLSGADLVVGGFAEITPKVIEEL